MLEKTQGIVLNYVKFRESSVIVHIFTEQFGLRSYIENGIRSAKSKNKIALFQPLTLLDLVVFEKENKSIKRISEMKCAEPYHSIPYDINKTSIALFLAEILKKTLKEESSNPQLYQFLKETFLYFDHTEIFSNFHLIFLVKMSQYMGFSPGNSALVLSEFQAVNLKPFSDDIFQLFNEILGSNFEENIKLSRQQRAEILDILLSFYRIHVADFGEVRSAAVLKEVLD